MDQIDSWQFPLTAVHVKKALQDNIWSPCLKLLPEPINPKRTWSDKGRVENAGTLFAHLMLMKRRRAADSHTDSVATS